jgi:hypothetical protein
MIAKGITKCHSPVPRKVSVVLLITGELYQGRLIKRWVLMKSGLIWSLEAASIRFATLLGVLRWQYSRLEASKD